MADFLTPAFKAAFPRLHEPWEDKDGKPQGYSVNAVWEPANFTEREKELWTEMNRFTIEECKREFGRSPKQLQGSDHKIPPMQAFADDRFAFLGEGVYFATMKCKHKPQIVDRKKQLLKDLESFIAADKDAICRAQIEIRAYVFGKYKGVSWKLMHIQKLGEIDKIFHGGKPPPPVENYFNDDISELPEGFTPQTVADQLRAEEDEIPF